jgi:predicted dithiol-disulfide oxidoreductase (DUF899 family)
MSKTERRHRDDGSRDRRARRVLEDGAVYQTYGTGARVIEFLMGYYGILDRAPRGRARALRFRLWIRRHDEY